MSENCSMPPIFQYASQVNSFSQHASPARRQPGSPQAARRIQIPFMIPFMTRSDGACIVDYDPLGRRLFETAEKSAHCLVMTLIGCHVFWFSRAGWLFYFTFCRILSGGLAFCDSSPSADTNDATAAERKRDALRTLHRLFTYVILIFLGSAFSIFLRYLPFLEILKSVEDIDRCIVR